MNACTRIWKCRIDSKMALFLMRGTILQQQWGGQRVSHICARGISLEILEPGTRFHRKKRSCSARAALQLHSQSSVAIDESYCPDLQGFAERVRFCNRGSEHKLEFVPFVVDGATVGYIHNRFARHLQRFPEVFVFESEGLSRTTSGMHPSNHKFTITLVSTLTTPQERTAAVGATLQVLNGEGLIPGWRDELYPVVLKYGAPASLAIERAAAPRFGSKAYGVHINGYVNIDGEKHLWVAKRSDTKQTFPGLHDHIAAGGQAEGLTCRDNVIKECDEEAAIPRVLAEKAIPVGAISYEDIDGENFKRDVLFCYDIELPADFQPYNKDGEVQSFVRLPMAEVANIISETTLYKPNCALVLIDFLVRHGHIKPDQKGYLQLLQSLRSGECI